jgi:hypothetical protein
MPGFLLERDGTILKNASGIPRLDAAAAVRTHANLAEGWPTEFAAERIVDDATAGDLFRQMQIQKLKYRHEHDLLGG